MDSALVFCADDLLPEDEEDEDEDEEDEEDGDEGEEDDEAAFNAELNASAAA